MSNFLYPIVNKRITEKISYTTEGLEEYHGWANVGSASSSEVWLICKKIYNASMQVTDIKWANKGRFVSEWDVKGSLNYE